MEARCEGNLSADKRGFNGLRSHQNKKLRTVCDIVLDLGGPLYTGTNPTVIPETKMIPAQDRKDLIQSLGVFVRIADEKERFSIDFIWENAVLDHNYFTSFLEKNSFIIYLYYHII